MYVTHFEVNESPGIWKPTGKFEWIFPLFTKHNESPCTDDNSV